MKIYRIYQEVNNEYDTFDSAVVYAKSEKEARFISPWNPNWGGKFDDDWCKAEDVQVEYLGEAKEGVKKGVIISSYNAG